MRRSPKKSMKVGVKELNEIDLELPKTRRVFDAQLYAEGFLFLAFLYLFIYGATPLIRPTTSNTHGFVIVALLITAVLFYFKEPFLLLIRSCWKKQIVTDGDDDELPFQRAKKK